MASARRTDKREVIPFRTYGEASDAAQTQPFERRNFLPPRLSRAPAVECAAAHHQQRPVRRPGCVCLGATFHRWREQRDLAGPWIQLLDQQPHGFTAALS